MNKRRDESVAEHRVRIRVFIDFWNFELSIKKVRSDFRINWHSLGLHLSREALRVIDETAHVDYQGMNVYGSYNIDHDQKLHGWAARTLDTIPGVHVTMVPRRRRHTGPTCPACHQVVSQCPICNADMRGTEEKGVDTRIATEMISLAWVDNYDVAVLVSSDRDFVPVVEFLGTRGIKVVHGAFPPQAAELTQKCWGSICIPSICEGFRRT